MSKPLRTVAMLGGTFNPIHIGHLRSAVELLELLRFEQIRFVPCHQPPHKAAPGVDSHQRLRMVELALQDEPGLVVDDRELRRVGPSFSVDTLIELRAELGSECSLALVMGADAFAALESWHRWTDLLSLAHLVVLARPDFELPATGPVADLLRAHRALPDALYLQPSGCVVCVSLTPLPVSATLVRDLIQTGHSPRYLVPDAVWTYIRAHHLYQADVIGSTLS